MLEESLADVVKRAAKTSMGADISEADVERIKALATQVVEISEYREGVLTSLSRK